MRVGKPSLLSSILAFLKKFKLHTVYWTLFWGFRADKTFTTCWSGCWVQVWVQVQATADQCLSSGNHSKRLFEKTIEEFNCKIKAKLLGQGSFTAWAGLTGKHKHRAFPSRLQSLLAATCSLEENMLRLLRYWLSLTVKKVLMLCRYLAVTTDFFFIGNEISIKWATSCCWSKQRPSLSSILRSFVGLWAKIWHRNKTSCS